jgi:hypothetical protein
MPKKIVMDELLWRIEGLHTVETVAEELGIKKQSALNLLSRLKKEMHVTINGGGRQKHIYRITIRKQLPRCQGMFDIINKYSPMKINPWYDHQVHGKYTVEDALVDAIETKSFRVILAAMHLYGHVKNWSRLYQLAKKRNCWQQVGALYDVTRMFMKVRRMPKKYNNGCFIRWYKMTMLKNKNFPRLAKKWKVYIPINIHDVRSMLNDYA